TPDQVIAEMEAIYHLGWRREVFICDDNFVGYRDQARAILTKLIPWVVSHDEPFSFWTQTSVNLGQDLEMIDLLTAANFATVFIGVESPDEEVLHSNRKYQNIKNPLGQSLSNICANGLSLMASFVFGFDNEKPGVDKRVCAFVEQHHLPIVVLNILQVLPNTSLWERLHKEGRLVEKMTSGDTQDFQLNYVPTRPAAEILAEFRATVDRLYEPSRYLERAYRYFLTMRPTRRFLAEQKGEATESLGKKQSRFHQDNLRDLAGLGQLLWQHGVRAGYRAQFWRQLWGIYRQNPSRLVKYLLCLALGENMFRLREEVLRKAAIS
ncbi:MAG: DUF4070 domain-containing protein, partial [Deltaproteobacteria bacterium]|nr:DUF4070 domain-containing protein [Deltaproteobacteria bacterium]